MAISVPSSATMMSTLSSDHHSCTLICSSTTTTIKPSVSSKSYSSLSSLHLRRQFGIRTSSSSSLSLRRSSRTLPVVEAKKETFGSFDELIANSDKPVLVDFYALWCGPCQLMVPILEKVNETMKDKIKLVKIDTEKYTAIANKYQIEALPTFILFKDGKPCDRFEGALPADKLIDRIEAALAVKQ